MTLALSARTLSVHSAPMLRRSSVLVLCMLLVPVRPEASAPTLSVSIFPTLRESLVLTPPALTALLASVPSAPALAPYEGLMSLLLGAAAVRCLGHRRSPPLPSPSLLGPWRFRRWPPGPLH